MALLARRGPDRSARDNSSLASCWISKLLAVEMSEEGRRPRIDRELRELIRRMSMENSLWGASRIHGELLMLGFEVAQSTVSKYMVRRRKPPSQTWKTFLRNHAEAIRRPCQGNGNMANRRERLAFNSHAGADMAKMKKAKRWTKKEFRELKAHSKAKTPVIKISKQMKRTVGALRQQASRLGIGLGHQRM